MNKKVIYKCAVSGVLGSKRTPGKAQLVFGLCGFNKCGDSSLCNKRLRAKVSPMAGGSLPGAVSLVFGALT